MSSTTAICSLAENLRVREFFVARQPILGRAQDLFAYELLFRSAESGPALITSDLSATASVISHVSQLGLEKVIGELRGFVNVDAAVLMSDIFHFLPREKIVLEILESMKATPETLARVAELSAAGFIFALDDVVADTTDVGKLLPYADIVKLDLHGIAPDRLMPLSSHFKRQGKKLLAEKVETQEQFQTCLELGFDYFQGYYFAKPAILRGKKLSPSQMALMRIMALVVSEADDSELEHAIKHDVALSINLLRLVNSPALGMRQRITSLSQALMVLGRQQLKRWLQIMLYADPNRTTGSTAPLLTLATTRGKLLELLAQHLQPGARHVADTAFTVGIMSLMHTLFSMSMSDMLEQIPVIDDVAEALLTRSGFYGDLLKLAESLEHIEDAGGDLPLLLQRLNLSSDELCRMEVAAFEWSNSVSRDSLQHA
jgi:EAL and modified HD-GYP domain-containing signal transduction protein